MGEQVDRDIVDELEDWAFIITEATKSQLSVVMIDGEVFRDATEEIKRLRSELQAARSIQAPAWSGQAPYSPTTETKDMRLGDNEQ